MADAASMEIEITIGYRVWSLRKSLSLLREQLAKSCGMAPAGSSRIERDEGPGCHRWRKLPAARA
jgi:hypothetical protein